MFTRLSVLVAVSLGITTAFAAEPVLKPDDLPSDLTVWPNQTSYRNSDRWLVQNHDKIRRMEPRVLVINFANTHAMEQIEQATEKYIAAIAESTRYHGFENPDAPPFLNYRVVKYVDMRDRAVPPERAKRNSAFFPYLPKDDRSTCDYSQFFSEAYARFYGFQHPDDHTRYLTLGELINAGIVHELWFHAIHDDRGAPLETIEIKQYYDKNLRPIEGKHGPAGNGHHDSIQWVGRSFRITFLNVNRGIGCGMENLGHAMEGMAHYGFSPYFRQYFYEFGEFNLDERYPQLPANSLYPMLWGEGNHAEYPDKTTMVVHSKGETYRLEDYVAQGGNVHFPPGARRHYDLKSPYVVKTVIETWRQGDRPGEHGPPHDFDKARFQQYNDVAPDCMGAWLIYWRQCMPGLDNAMTDDDGRPMKNWWVFLFY